MASREELEVLRFSAIDEQAAAAKYDLEPQVGGLNQQSRVILPELSPVVCFSPVVYRRERVFRSDKSGTTYNYKKITGAATISGQYGGITSGIIETNFHSTNGAPITKLGFNVFDSHDHGASYVVPVEVAEIHDVTHELGRDDFTEEVDEIAHSETATFQDLAGLIEGVHSQDWRRAYYEAYLRCRLSPAHYLSWFACNYYLVQHFTDDSEKFLQRATDPEAGVGHAVTKQDTFGIVATDSAFAKLSIEKNIGVSSLVLILDRNIPGYELV